MADPKSSNYLSTAFGELFKEDGLAVLGRGLGMHNLVSKFLDIYNDRKRLVFCLNASNYEVGKTFMFALFVEVEPMIII